MIFISYSWKLFKVEWLWPTAPNFLLGGPVLGQIPILLLSRMATFPREIKIPNRKIKRVLYAQILRFGGCGRESRGGDNEVSVEPHIYRIFTLGAGLKFGTWNIPKFWVRVSGPGTIYDFLILKRGYHRWGARFIRGCERLRSGSWPFNFEKRMWKSLSILQNSRPLWHLFAKSIWNLALLQRMFDRVSNETNLCR